MSGKNFALAYVPLAALGALGIWLSYQIRDASDFRSWLGPLLSLGAGVGLLIAFRRDLRTPEQEQKAEWEQMKVKGKLHFVLSQVGVLVLGWMLSLLTYALFELYGGARLSETLLFKVRSHALMIVLFMGFICVMALCQWYWLERKYRKAAA